MVRAMDQRDRELNKVIQEARAVFARRHPGNPDADDAFQNACFKLANGNQLLVHPNPRALLLWVAKKRLLSLSTRQDDLRERDHHLTREGDEDRDDDEETARRSLGDERPPSVSDLPLAALLDLPHRDVKIVLADVLGESRDDLAAAFGLTRVNADKIISRSNAVVWAWRAFEELGRWKMPTTVGGAKTWADFAVLRRGLRDDFARRHEVPSEKVDDALAARASELGRLLQVGDLPRGLIDLLELPGELDAQARAARQTPDDLRGDLLLVKAEHVFKEQKAVVTASVGRINGRITLNEEMLDLATSILAGERDDLSEHFDAVHAKARQWRDEVEDLARDLAVARASAEGRSEDAILVRYGLKSAELRDCLKRTAEQLTIQAEVEIMLAARRLWSEGAAADLTHLDRLRVGKAGSETAGPRYKAVAEAIGRAMLLGYTAAAIQQRVPCPKKQTLEDVFSKTSIRAWFQELAFEIRVADTIGGGRSPDDAPQDFGLTRLAAEEIKRRLDSLRLDVEQTNADAQRAPKSRGDV